jgi:hypothetical protein
MGMRKRRASITVAALLATITLGVGGGTSWAEGTSGNLTADVPSPFVQPIRQARTTFVSEDTAADIWLAVVLRGDSAIGYVCDGADVWGLLRGTFADGKVTLSGSGSRFVGRRSNGAVSGVLTMRDGDTDVRLVRATSGESGLYRLVDEGTVTWWIQTEAGLKGASRTGRRTKSFETADAQGFETGTAAGGAGDTGA